MVDLQRTRELPAPLGYRARALSRTTLVLFVAALLAAGGSVRGQPRPVDPADVTKTTTAPGRLLPAPRLRERIQVYLDHPLLDQRIKHSIAALRARPVPLIDLAELSPLDESRRLEAMQKNARVILPLEREMDGLVAGFTRAQLRQFRDDPAVRHVAPFNTSLFLARDLCGMLDRQGGAQAGPQAVLGEVHSCLEALPTIPEPPEVKKQMLTPLIDRLLVWSPDGPGPARSPAVPLASAPPKAAGADPSPGTPRASTVVSRPVPGPDRSAPSPGGVPVWIAGSLALLAGAGALAVALRSRDSSEAPDRAENPPAGLDPSLQAHLLPPRYTGLKFLSRGGMGVVLSATDRNLGRKIALKLVAPELRTDMELVSRFQREARALAAVSHPNIVRLYDVQTQPLPFFTMEFIEGVGLDRFLEERLEMNVRQSLFIGLQVARALEHLHSREFIHRDVKPENILLLPDGTAKLVDFGLVRTDSWTRVTRTSAAVGTPRYMAPEALTDGAIDARSDLFSLGIVLFQLLTGRYPFPGGGLTPQLLGTAAPMDSTVPGVTPVLASLVDSCLAREPLVRPPSATFLAAGLASELAGFERSFRGGGATTRLPER